MTWARLKKALLSAWNDLLNNHVLQVAAALSYYLVLSVFPGLIFLSAVLGSLQMSYGFDRVLGLMARLLPADSMHLVHSVLLDVLGAHRKAWFSLGMIGTVWATSTAFAAIIEALDIAYDVKEERPMWKNRLLAIGLAAVIGTLVVCSLTVMVVGPRFGTWLASRIHLSHAFVVLWPSLRWIIAVGFTVLAVELLYFLAPYVKQRFLATLPGAILAVGCWIGLSYLLGFYFRHVADFSKTYGTLGGFVAFMTWFYWNSVALLVGAELNAELAKESAQGKLAPKGESQAQPQLPLDRVA